MASALMRKSYRELTRHRIRSVLTIITIAAAVTGLWLFAIPLGLDNAMARRAAADQLHDIRMSPNNLLYVGDPAERPSADQMISAEELDDLRALPNVAAVEARPIMWTQLRRGGDVHDIWLVGVEDFAEQHVNIVSVEEGEAPTAPLGGLEALLDPASALTGGATAIPGEQIGIKAGDGEFYPFVVSGLGATIRWSAVAADVGPIVYVPAETVRLFTASEGFNTLELKLVDNAPDAAKATLAEVRSYLERVAPEMTYHDVPDVRAPGSWHGKDQVFRMLPLLYVISFMAVASALILVSTTMNTIVSQQTAQIGVMKAVGGSRRAIVACYLRSVLLLGGIGTVIGTVAGVIMSSAFGRFVQEDLGGIRAMWSTNPWFVIVGIAAGLGSSVLASLPALRRATRVTVREALGSHGVADGREAGLLERATRRATFLSSPTQLGLRNTARRRSRSLATSAQVALGVGTVLAFSVFSLTALAATQITLQNESGDLRVYHTPGLFDDDEARLLASRIDVDAVQPVLYSKAEFGGDERPAWGLPADPIYDYDLSAGRWFTDEDVTGVARVAVIGRPLAAMTHTEVGDHIDLGTKSGVETVEVIGIDENLVHDGKFIWLPLETAKILENQPFPNVYWVETTSPEPEVVDRVAEDIRSVFAAAGNSVTVDVHYRDMAAAAAEDRVVVGVIQMLGLPIVAIGMIGLVSTMTTNVLERTREIGILRALGARARHVRRAFRAEGVALAAAGWLIGIPVGYVLARVIVWFFGRAMHTSFSLVFPPWLPLVALAGVIVVARLTLRPPLRRAVRMRPGDALRYE
ncbi:MAG TPA: FtsX-like permease family protein [Acidimicrobiia bacterium]|nr:FtsX-like permease family protein [Acidimicrobiia bacterium]